MRYDSNIRLQNVRRKLTGAVKIVIVVKSCNGCLDVFLQKNTLQ